MMKKMKMFKKLITGLIAFTLIVMQLGPFFVVSAEAGTGDMDSSIKKTVDRILERSENNVLNGATPCRGESHALAIYVTFPDLPAQEGYTVDDINRMMFEDAKDDANLTTQFDSLAGFYRRTSYGKLNITGHCYEYTMAKNTTEYASGNDIYKEAIDNVIADNHLNASDFDKNNDGYFDAVYLLTTNINSPLGGGNCVASFSCESNGLKMNNAMFIGMGYATDVSTIAHETCHMMGLPDIYGGVGVNAGGTHTDSIMDGMSTDLPGVMKIFFGWMDCKEATQSANTEFTLGPTNEQNQLLILYPNGNKSSKYVLVVEYLTKTLNQMNNWNLSEDGSVRIWRMFLNTDDDGNIIGNDTATGGCSPYDFLDTIHPADLDMKYYTTGDTLSAYEKPSTYYSTSFYLKGSSKYATDMLFSGINITSMNMQDGVAHLNVQIDESPTQNVPMQYTYDGVNQLNSYTENNYYSLAYLSCDVEMMVKEDASAFIDYEGTQMPVQVKANNDGSRVYFLISPENMAKLEQGTEYNLVIPKGIVFNALGRDNVGSSIPIKANCIDTFVADGDQVYYINRKAENYLSPSHYFEVADGQIVTITPNCDNDSKFQTKTYKMVFFDGMTGKENEIELENPTDGLFTYFSDRTSDNVYQLSNGHLILAILTRTNLYMTEYDTEGNLVKTKTFEINTNGIMRYFYNDTLLVETDGLYDVHVGDEITMTKNEVITNRYSQFSKINDNYVARWTMDGNLQLFHNGLIEQERELKESLLDVLSGTSGEVVKYDLWNYGHAMISDGKIILLSIIEHQLIMTQYDMNLNIEKCQVLENVPLYMLLTETMNVFTKNNLTYFTFEAVPDYNSVTYATTFLYSFDADWNPIQSYFAGNSTEGFHGIYFPMSDGRVISSFTNYFQVIKPSSTHKHCFDEEFTVDEEATTESTGLKSHHCAYCDAKTGVTVISMLDPNPDPDPDPDPDPSEPKQGDVDRNGVINVLDMEVTQKHILGISSITDANQFVLADMDGNGILNVLDMEKIQKIILGIK
jgi:M6 family metalloprotease-like protein